jgi:hypothetical protein
MAGIFDDMNILEAFSKIPGMEETTEDNKDNPVVEEKKEEPQKSKEKSKENKELTETSVVEEMFKNADKYNKKNTQQVKENDEEEFIENNDKENNSGEDSPGSEDIESFNLYAAALKESGVLPDINMEEFNSLGQEDKANYLITEQQKAIQDTAYGMVEEWMDGLPSPLRRALENYTDGVPIKDVIDSTSNLQKYEGIDPDKFADNQQLAKQIIIEERLSRGYSREDIEEELESMVDFTKTAKKSLSKLIEHEGQKVEQIKERRKVEEQERQVEAKKAVERINNILNTSKEIIPGITMPEKLKNSVYKTLTTPIDKDVNGNLMNKIAVDRAKDPINFEIKLTTVYEMTKGFTDFTVFKNIGKTSAVADLQKALEKNDRKSGKGNLPEYKKPGKDDDLNTPEAMWDFFGHLAT